MNLQPTAPYSETHAPPTQSPTQSPTQPPGDSSTQSPTQSPTQTPTQPSQSPDQETTVPIVLVKIEKRKFDHSKLF